MSRPFVRTLLILGIIGVVLARVIHVLRGEPLESVRNHPASAPTPPVWREPVDGTVPAAYPIKANLRSGIFHEPGQQFYDRTHPDRCYARAEDALADGLRAAKR